MRKFKAISYTSLSLWERNREEFYLTYLADPRPPRHVQDRAPAIGSAFDAYVKSWLSQSLFQKPVIGLLERQVEPLHREWAKENGRHVFDSYQRCGAYDDLLDVLRLAKDIRLEASLDRTIDGIRLIGKQDLSFSWAGTLVILDWKVRGYCSRSATSPMKGYMLCRDADESKQHPDFVPTECAGLRIGQAGLPADYADQTATYSWLIAGEPVPAIGWIEELVCKPAEPMPAIRVATHRETIGRDHQLQLMGRIKTCWESVQSGHIFTDLSRADSDELCSLLDGTAAGLHHVSPAFNRMTRSRFSFAR